MPFADVRGAQLYYEAFGKDQPGRTPLLLIHGSTGTGRSHWDGIAQLLAHEYRVILPDCRGHGQSTNPNHSYSFREMAADMAELVRALGYRRAHVIGHSNGGNIALVMLVEDPEAVQTCVVQAANAYVSHDLVEREPHIFDPERVAGESPEWMNEMIALHGSTHGQDYWRELLQLTLQETISQPNYAAADLARVTRPTLVIQGGRDPVNAPSQHAQFIARNISHAELWLPEGTGHNVHQEQPGPWLERVLDFLARRGDEANDALYRLHRARYADRRETVFEVRASLIASHAARRKAEGLHLRLEGQVLTTEQLEAARAALPVSPVSEHVQVLLTGATPWALVNRNLTDLLREPHFLAERLSQALMGEVVQVLEEREEWAHVRLERDGYLGWVKAAALYRCRREEALAYRAACDMVVIAELAQARATPASPNSMIGEGTGWNQGKLPFGILLPAVERRGEAVGVRLPDGAMGWVDQNCLLPVSHRPMPDRRGRLFAIELIGRSLGVPYLWGGRTPFGFDCSGLAQTLWGFLGVDIPRDADQQFRAGTPVEGRPEAGDLLFFGETDNGEDPANRSAPVTHVAISLDADRVIHANSTAGGVFINDLNPDMPNYRAWLHEHLVGVRRFA